MTAKNGDPIKNLIQSLVQLLRQFDLERDNHKSENKQVEKVPDPPSITNREYLTVQEVATKTGFDEATVRIWLKLGELKGYKFGRPWRINLSDYNKFCEQRGI